MYLTAVRNRLTENGYGIRMEVRLPNDSGTQLRLENGAIVNVYDNGNHNVQGTNTESVRNLLEGIASSEPSIVQNGVSNEIFVVYGHDEIAKTQLDAILRRWGLTPLFLDQLPSEGQTIIEKIEYYTDRVKFAVVLATPDDEGHRKDRTQEKKFRARQNVVLELGMMLRKLGRKQVPILLKTPELMEKPSDIAGLIYISFGDSIDAAAQVKLAREMNSCGYNIQVSDLA